MYPDLSSFKNCTLMLMGSATELPKEPQEKPKFIEDMTDEELATAVSHCKEWHS